MRWSRSHFARGLGSGCAMEVTLRLRERADDELPFAMQADPVQVTADGEAVGTLSTFAIGGERFIGDER